MFSDKMSLMYEKPLWYIKSKPGSWWRVSDRNMANFLLRFGDLFSQAYPIVLLLIQGIVSARSGHCQGGGVQGGRAAHLLYLSEARTAIPGCQIPLAALVT